MTVAIQHECSVCFKKSHSVGIIRGRNYCSKECYSKRLADEVLAERKRCIHLALDYAARLSANKDIFDTFTSYAMEELAEHIRRGDTKWRNRSDNDNDDTVMK